MPRGRKAVTGAVTIAILFLVVMVAALLLFSYFTGFLNLGVQSQGKVSASGTMQPGSSGASALIFVSVSNTASMPVTSVTFTCPSSSFSDSSCNGLTVLYNNEVLSAQNTLPLKGVASGGSQVQAAAGTTFSYGTLYVITCVVTFSNGSSQAVGVALSQG